jgi:aspartyl-tRNA(Asn)/glutamyl-tRNA(Gln) amidotransferase subunit C
VISRETVLHVARLAELSLGDDEVEPLTQDLATIISYVEQLAQVDTEGVGPLQPPGGLTRWRVDEAIPGLSHDDALAGATHTADGGFAVPPFVTR